MGSRRVIRTLWALIGAVVGGFGGFVLGWVAYELTKPPWGQFGYEFEGLLQAFVGATVGVVLGVTLGHLGFI